MNRLFRSQTCFSILQHLFQNKERALYLRELAAGIQADPANVNRELKRLVSDGFVIKVSRAARPYYQIAQHAGLFALLSSLPTKQAELSISDKSWIAGLELSRPNHLLSRCWIHGFIDPAHKYRHDSVYAVFRQDSMTFYYDQDCADAIGKSAADALKSTAYMKEASDVAAASIRELFEFAYLLPQEGVQALSSAELYRLYRRHEEFQRGVAVHAFKGIVAEAAWRESAMTISKDAATLHVLTRNEEASVVEAETESLLAIAAELQADKDAVHAVRHWYEQYASRATDEWTMDALAVKESVAMPSLSSKHANSLHEHHARYGVVGYASEGKLRSFQQVFGDVARLVCHDDDCAATLARLRGRRQERAQQRAGLAVRLKLTKEQSERFRLYGEWQSLKQERRLVQELALYKMRPVLEAIASKLGLSLAELDVLLPQEIEASLLSGKPLHRHTIHERLRCSVYAATAGGAAYFIGGDAEASAAVLANPSRRPRSVHLRGVTARRGFAAGRVRLVRDAAEAKLVQRGDIVVAPLLRPELVGMLPQAAAFVTEQGGITSHAAILARELGIPCVVSVKNALSSLFDGQTAEVDADHGIIRASH